MPTSPEVEARPKLPELPLISLNALLLGVSYSTVNLCREFKVRYAPVADNHAIAMDMERWLEEYLDYLKSENEDFASLWNALEESQREDLDKWMLQYQNVVSKAFLYDPDVLEAPK